MKRVARLVVVACVLMGAAWATAQEVDLAKPWGASVTVGSQYTDNRDGRDQNKESNLDLYIEPRGDLYWRDGERTTLNLFLSPMAKWHSNPRDVDEGDAQNDSELFGSGGIDLTHELDPRLGFKFSDTLVYNDDPSQDVGGTSVRESASHVFNGAYGDISVGVTPQVAVDLIGRSTIKRYSDEELAKNQDEDTVDTEVDVGYLLGSGYKVFVMAGYTTFDNESTDRSRGITIQSFGAGVEKYLTPDVRARLMGGYQDAEYSDHAIDNADTVNGKAEFLFRPKSATRFRVGALYGFYTPYVQPYSVQKLMGLQGAIDHDVLAERLTVTLRGQLSNSDYDEEGADLPGGDDNLTTAGIDATYRLNRNWAVSAGYTYETWSSDVREEFSRSYVDASIKASL